MSIIKNGKNIIGVYKGDIPILKIFKHNNLVYQHSSTGGTETQYDITSTFNVTSTTSQTQLCYSSATSAFTEMYVDGIQIDVSSGYTFNTLGEHTVGYTLSDKTKIVDSSFQNCKRLSSIVIPDTVTSVGTYSFFGCSSLTSIDFGKGLKTIGNAVFYYCSSLTYIVIPNSVVSIGPNAFYTCYFYKDNFINNSSATGYPWSAVIYDTVQDDGLYILGTTVVKCKQDATNVTIPESITDIGNEAFLGCSILSEITCLGTTAPTLEGDVFSSLPSNGTLTYPCESDYSAWLEQLGWKDTCNPDTPEEGVKWVTLTQDTYRSIQMQTFRIDTSPTPTPEIGEYFITFSTSPNYPGDNAYLTDFSICIEEDRIYDNGSMKNIRDQKHIEGNVYEYTFSVPVYFAGGERNAPLSQVQYKTTSGDTPEEPGEGIPDYNVTNYDVKASFDVTSTTSQTKLCYSSMTTAFTEMYIDGEPYGIASGYIFNTTGKHTVHYVLKNNTILTGDSSNGLFKDCSDLEEMVIKDSVKTINDNVFTNCSKLKKITIGSGLTKLGNGISIFAKPVFSGCTSLTSITCYATTAPTLTKKTFNGIESNGGVLHIPQGSDYSAWTSVLTSWTIQYLT